MPIPKQHISVMVPFQEISLQTINLFYCNDILDIKNIFVLITKFQYVVLINIHMFVWFFDILFSFLI